METITYKSIIIGFVILIAIIVTIIVLVAVKMGKKYRQFTADQSADKILIEAMEIERLQNKRIIKILEGKDTIKHPTHFN